MEAALPAQSRSGFPRIGAVGISLGLHALLIFALLGSALFAPPRIDNSETIHVKLARLGTPRDAKLLPRKQEEPVQVPAPPVEVSKTVPVQSKTEKKPTDKDAKANENKLKNALAKLQKQVDQTGQTDGFETGTDDVTEGDLYLARIKDRIQRFYIVPNTIPDAERKRLVASMALRIARDGSIAEARIDHGSGNPTFDRALESAIHKAHAFPPPPEHLVKQLAEGIALEFRADKM